MRRRPPVTASAFSLAESRQQRFDTSRHVLVPLAQQLRGVMQRLQARRNQLLGGLAGHRLDAPQARAHARLGHDAE